MADIDFMKYFVKVMNDIKSDYPSNRFFVERDFVWEVQKRLQTELEEINNKEENKINPYIVYNDFPVEPGKNQQRNKCVDLAVVRENEYKRISKEIIDGKGLPEFVAEFVAEFKFEPSKEREGVQRHKSTVVAWNDVKKDITRIRDFVVGNDKAKVKVKIAVAVFVDEYGYKKNKSDRDWKQEVKKAIKGELEEDEKKIIKWKNYKDGIKLTEWDNEKWTDEKKEKLKVSVLWAVQPEKLLKVIKDK